MPEWRACLKKCVKENAEGGEILEKSREPHNFFVKIVAPGTSIVFLAKVGFQYDTKASKISSAVVQMKPSGRIIPTNRFSFPPEVDHNLS